MPGSGTRNGLSSSGFHSDVTSKTSQLKQSFSSTYLPSGTTSSGVATEVTRPNVPSLTSLWGHSALDTRQRRESSDTAPTRLLSRLGSQRSVPTHINNVTVSEIDLLRELVFVLNGTGGNLIHFDQIRDAFCLAPDVSIHPGDCDSVRRIAECGWLLLQIQRFISRTQQDRLSGPMCQSLASGLHENLTEYYRLVATLEAQLGRESRGTVELSARSADEERPESGGLYSSNYTEPRSQNNSADGLMTLTRLALWTQEPRFRLRFLASLCDVCRGKRGGALASELYAYTLHGDSDVVGMMRFMLRNLASTLLHFISLWIYDGQLDDPFQEFFVACNSSIKKERLWHEKYSLRRPMIPTFITLSQANKILLAGKAINFLHYACGEKQTIKDRDVIRNSRLRRVESMFEQDSDPSFDKMVSLVYKQTSRYLLETLIDHYHFMDHLRATRQFLLLGQGDFITHLMDLLGTELNKPATQSLTHRLTNALETAIRATNAQYEQPEILQRLHVRLLEMCAGDVGWDVFSLDYHVDGPLATIFTDDCRLMYLRGFNFLWRAKRMEFCLSTLWKCQFVAARMTHGLGMDLEPVLHLSELLGAEIRHCVQQVQYYVNFEVLECGWENLVKQIHVATDLDEVIEAHQTFLSNVLTRCLLDPPSRQLIAQLRTIFDLVLSFTQLFNDLIGVANAELAVRERYANEVSEATRRGKWGTDEAKEAQENVRRAQFVQRHVGPFQARVRILASTYRDMVVNFIRMLCAHPDHNLRFLAEHLNFNGHYHYQTGSSGSGRLGSNTDVNSFGSSSAAHRSGPVSSGSSVPEKVPSWKDVSAGDLR